MSAHRAHIRSPVWLDHYAEQEAVDPLTNFVHDDQGNFLPILYTGSVGSEIGRAITPSSSSARIWIKSVTLIPISMMDARTGTDGVRWRSLPLTDGLRTALRWKA